MSDKITIAIDGFSSCGKSTLAKQLAHRLHYIFIDSGAMYRGVTLYALRNKGILNQDINRKQIIHLLDEIQLQFKLNPETKSPELFLNEENVSEHIRTPMVSSFVSQVAAIKEVREKLVAEQRAMGLSGGIVMDGRDIGSVVFPTAELKLFITANMDIRVQRRHAELSDKGIEISAKDVMENLIKRDHIDSTRKESPLVQTSDAIVIDNSDMNREEQLELALEIVQKRVSSLA